MYDHNSRDGTLHETCKVGIQLIHWPIIQKLVAILSPKVFEFDFLQILEWQQI